MGRWPRRTPIRSTGTSPTALAIDPQGAFLYVTYTYQTGYSRDQRRWPGGVTIFPVNADNSLGTAANVRTSATIPVGRYGELLQPLCVCAGPGATANPQVLGFSQNTSTGALTPVPGTTITTVGGNTVATGYAAGVVPSAIAEEPTSRFVYVTDQAANQLIGYTVQPSGALVAMINGPFQTGLFPANLTIDPQGTMMYVVNYNANTVQGYAIDTITGTPSGVVGAFATATGTGPTCVAGRSRAGHLPVHLGQPGQYRHRRAAEPEHGRIAARCRIRRSRPGAGASPTCLAIVPNGCARFADHLSVVPSSGTVPSAIRVRMKEPPAWGLFVCRSGRQVSFAWRKRSGFTQLAASIGLLMHGLPIRRSKEMVCAISSSSLFSPSQSRCWWPCP